MDLPALYVVGYFALLGAALGSFLNVCILRWGAEPKQSVMHPPSRCPACGHAIRWHENIPIVSWLVLRGRCAGCGTRISPMYPAIEGATAVLWGASAALHGPSLSAVQLAVASTLLLGIAVSDARAFIIPHEFSLGGTAIAIAFAAWPEPIGVLAAVQGALFGAGLVLLVGEVTELVLGQEAMGGGDCALMGMVGAFFGWESVWPVLALGAFIGLALHLGLTLRGRAPVPPDGPVQTGAPAEPGRTPAGLRWGKLMLLLAGGLALAGLVVGAASVGVIGGVLRAVLYAVVGAGAAYYLSFVLPRRMPGGPITQVWGLLGAALGIAIGTAHWIGILAGLALGGGSLAWASRQTVAASPASIEELSEQGYLPFGIGLSIAAVVLAYSGGFERVREIFADIAIGLGV
jgi:leader peptidase (prepilin peptidase)/N-methyltransferase